MDVLGLIWWDGGMHRPWLWLGHLSMVAVSESSTMKVDCPAMMWSLAPMRTWTASMGESRRDSAGTQAPTCAMTAESDTCRSSVDLPPMLAPVSSMKGAEPSPPMAMSLGTKQPWRPVSPAGWQSDLASKKGFSAKHHTAGRIRSACINGLPGGEHNQIKAPVHLSPGREGKTSQQYHWSRFGSRAMWN